MIINPCCKGKAGANLCDNFARLGKSLRGCEPQPSPAGCSPQAEKTPPSRTSSWQAALGWALGCWAGLQALGRWDAHSLAYVGRQALEVCSPSRSCLRKHSWKRRWDGNRIKMLDVSGKYPRQERLGAEPPARTTSPRNWGSLHHWRLSRCNQVLNNLIQAPFPTKG